MGVYLPLELILFTLNSHGSHDHLFQAVVQRALYSASVGKCNDISSTFYNTATDFQASQKGAPLDGPIQELNERLGSEAIAKR